MVCFDLNPSDSSAYGTLEELAKNGSQKLTPTQRAMVPTLQAKRDSAMSRADKVNQMCREAIRFHGLGDVATLSVNYLNQSDVPLCQVYLSSCQLRPCFVHRLNALFCGTGKARGDGGSWRKHRTVSGAG